MSDTNTTETDWAAEIGASAYGCLAEMVAALECDYDRLAELRDERADKDAKPDELRLPAWDAENAEELAELAAEAGDCTDRDDAEQRIHEDPLSVQVRSGWCDPGTENMGGAEEFEIVLSTGGPATRIVGELDDNGEPSRARLQVQDWFKPWTEYFPADSEVLLTYARCFTFGE